MDYKVSVIVPVYNVENLLSKCVDSLVAQTLESVQIILIDDGSTDRSAEIAKEYAQKYSNIEVYCKENGGSASARNVGLVHAKGEYIGFVDSDDWVEPDMYECLYNVGVDSGADIVFARVFEDETTGAKDYFFPRGGFYNRYDMETQLFPYIMPCLINGELKSLRWSNPMHIYKRAIIENYQIRYFEGSRRCEDFAFNFECTIHSKRYYYFDEKSLYHNYLNPNSKTRNYNKRMWTSISALMEYMKSLVENYNDYDFRKQNEISTFKFCVDCVWNEMRSENKKESYQQLKMMMDDPLCSEIVSNPVPEGIVKSNKLIWKALRTKSPLIVIGSLKLRKIKIKMKEKAFLILHPQKSNRTSH